MIIIKTQKEIEVMREGGKILAEIMQKLGEAICPGQNTMAINMLAKKLVADVSGVAVFEGYGEKSNPFPGAVCVSLNDEIVHGVPNEARIIHEGDLVKLDIGMKYNGMITDMARTFPVGKISIEAQKILDTTKKCLDDGIGKIVAGRSLREYSCAVEKCAKEKGFSVVRELVGHGVGRELHEDPQIFNYATNVREVILREGMTLALEPMINAGKHSIKILPDGWTFSTKDGKLSAHFEDTVLVTKNGAEILTRI